MKTNYPKIGIRSIIDGRCHGIRESLENMMMRLAWKVAQLYCELLHYPDDSSVACIIADTCIGGVKESADCAKKNRTRRHWGIYRTSVLLTIKSRLNIYRHCEPVTKWKGEAILPRLLCHAVPRSGGRAT